MENPADEGDVLCSQDNGRQGCLESEISAVESEGTLCVERFSIGCIPSVERENDKCKMTQTRIEQLTPSI